MRRLGCIAFILMCANILACAQDACQFGGDEAADASAKALEQAKTCNAAATKMHNCAWGSSLDGYLATIVVSKCEKTFLEKLSPAGKKRYHDEMQLCGYEYARQEGTMYRSAAALCAVDVAARFAAHPEVAGQPLPRASFDCDKAQTALETAICSDETLGHADIVLSRVYARMLQGADKKNKPILVQSEKRWLQSVPAKCALSHTPPSQESLKCVRDEFEQRFTALDSCMDDPDCVQPADEEKKQRADP
ncbi:MAG TPA: lysozyme inhibitor LprI family protein [Terriglobia bacterium]|nr:lysozyme inhibitor LprI family protein [Terriglobia bacterium]